MIQQRGYTISDFKELAYLLIVPGLKLFYFVVNRIPRPATNVLTAVDNYIPVIPIFVIPYMLFYPFVLTGLVILFCSNRSVYTHIAVSYAVGLVICYATYLLFQTTVPRPELVGHDLFTSLLRYIYLVDKPYNCLPSIHVLGTTLVASGLSSVSRHRAAINLLGALIIISTLFTKQHGVLDVVTALALSAGLHFYFGKRSAIVSPASQS